MSAECPVCHAPQDEGLACHSCCTTLERELTAVPGIIADLDVAISRQARIGGGGKGGLARERMPINLGAMAVADDLANTLSTWARDITGDRYNGYVFEPVAQVAARILLARVPEIRRHPAVAELHDEVIDATRQARRAVDRPAEQQFLGTCYVPDPEHDDQPCDADLYARAGASGVTCKVCGITHDVAERRAWLLGEAEDRLFTVQEAAQIIGSYGNLRISESTIRTYVSTDQLGYHGKVEGKSVIRMGDLLKVIARQAAKQGTRKLRRVI